MATIFDIQKGSFVDGPGIRTTVFFKGCNLRCAWCHNPESHEIAPQMLFDAEKCIGCGKCQSVCPSLETGCQLCGKCTLFCPRDAKEICGRTVAIEDVFEEIQKDRAFYQASGGGATFSGGECMLQMESLVALLKLCKSRGIHTAVDTAGHVPFSHFSQIIPYTDLFLFDIKCMDPIMHERYTGLENHLILENLKSLLSAGCSVWVRVPIVSGINDSLEEMHAIRQVFDESGWPEKVELLPYHAMGEHKYRELGLEAPNFSAPDEDTMKTLRAVFSN